MIGSNETYDKWMTIMKINEHSAVPILLHENETQILNKPTTITNLPKQNPYDALIWIT
jgi:hypothetical protein